MVKGKDRKEEQNKCKVYGIFILEENNKIFFKMFLFQIILFSLSATYDYDSLILYSYM